MKTFLLCAALLGAGLAQAADDIDDVLAEGEEIEEAEKKAPEVTLD